MPAPKLIFVTTNKHKFKEVAEILKASQISLKQKPLNLMEPEDSLEEIAREKAAQAYRILGRSLIVEDTGLYFKAYEGFPGTNPKKVFESLGFDGLFRLLKGKSRKAVFRTVICLALNEKKLECFSGEMKGKIAAKVVLPKKDVMPYDKIFIPEGFKKPIVQMTVKQKNKFSQRGKAARKLVERLNLNNV